MGTDIHLAVERKVDGKWKRVLPPDDFPRNPWIQEQLKKYESGEEKDIEDPKYSMASYYRKILRTSWYDGRNYYLFSILADVRNGRGFAGVLTGEGFNPISPPKGLPDDLSEELKQKDKYDESEDTDDYFDLGYHDFSWLTVKEMLDYDWNQTTKCCGVIPWEVFVNRIENNITGEPVEGYSGGISGPDILQVNAKQALQWLKEGGKPDKDVHVQIWWETKYSESASDFYDRILPYLAKLDPNPENVRIVFGFDS